MHCYTKLKGRGERKRERENGIILTLGLSRDNILNKFRCNFWSNKGHGLITRVMFYLFRFVLEVVGLPLPISCFWAHNAVLVDVGNHPDVDAKVFPNVTSAALNIYRNFVPSVYQQFPFWLDSMIGTNCWRIQWYMIFFSC